MSYYQDKVVWVTGASSGIGEALALAFAGAGAKVIISARRENELERVQSQCPQPENIYVLPLDLADMDSFKTKVEEAIRSFGHIDILMNNAGISQRSLAKNTPVDIDRRLMNINYLGTVALSKTLLPHFLERQNGHYGVITSLTGKIGSPMRSGYAGSKHALHGFFDSLRAELVDDNIFVTLIIPGFIRTDVSRNALTADGTPQNKMDERTAQGLSPEKMAQKVLRGLQRKKLEINVGKKELMALYVKRFFPALFAKMLAKAKVT